LREVPWEDILEVEVTSRENKETYPGKIMMWNVTDFIATDTLRLRITFMDPEIISLQVRFKSNNSSNLSI
jgi:hypothetical protein